MKNLKTTLSEFKKNKKAIAHFNFSDSTQFNALKELSRELQIPVILGLSEGEKKFIGIKNASALVKEAKLEGVDIFLNLDHAHSAEDCKEAIDLGFDSVMIDGSKLDFEDNVKLTKEVVDYANLVYEKTGFKTLVEGELGYIGSSSKLLDEIPEGAGLEKTNKEDALNFISLTGIDILAPSVGNIHGMLKGKSNPELDINRIKEISSVLNEDNFIVLHGGSGITDDDFISAIEAGVNIVHINTEIRKAYKEGIINYLNENPHEVAPYKYLGAGKENMKKVAQKRIELFFNS